MGWWYRSGWRSRMTIVKDRLARSFDFFSVDILIKTWFAPFRQISAGQVRGSLNVVARAWFDRLISRLIGGFVRTLVIIIGLVWLIVQSLIGLVELVFWILLPLFPVAGVILMIIGWLPL